MSFRSIPAPLRRLARLLTPAVVAFTALTALAVSAQAAAQPNPTYRFSTNLGDIDVVLRPDVAPNTVANFLGYVSRGAYSGSLIHRSVPGFVIQGGGYAVVNGSVNSISTVAAIQNEASLSNTRGTIAMALTGANINSATSQWYFNLVDNSASLDPQHFTVFGQAANSASLAVMDSIAAQQVLDLSASLGGAFTNVPVVNYTAGTAPTVQNLVLVSGITAVSGTPGPDYAITASPPILTILSGQTGSTTLTVTPSQGYAGTVTFTCGVLPTAANCTFAPTSVTFAATDTAAKTVTLTIGTSTHAAAPLVGPNHGSGTPPPSPAWLAALATLAAAGLWFGWRQGSARLGGLRGLHGLRGLRLALRPLAVAMAVTAVAGCGGGDSSSPAASTTNTPVGTYSIPITITDGTNTHPLALTVIVQ